MQNKLPQFEANQVLSSDHLNQVILYLEEQSRLTRNHLLGNGIVSGMDLKRSSTELIISEGVGVTSAGYLMLLQSQFMRPGTNGKGTISYNKKKVFQPKSLLFPYLGDMQNTAGSYELFNGITDIWQIVETDVADNTDPGNVTMLSADDLNNRVVVVFLQIGVKELKSCEADSCMELGRQWTYTAVPLLMHKTNADKLLQAEKGWNPAPAPNTDLGSLANPAYYLPDIIIQRVDLTKVSDTVSVQQLAGIYINAITSVFQELSKPIYQSVDSNLKQALKDNFSTAPVAEFIKKLVAILRGNEVVRRPEYYQYAYGFVQDFAQAYKELQTALVEYASYEIPALTSFPHHLRLGLVPANGGVLTSDMFPPQAYRHGFVSSRILEQQNSAYQDVVLMYKRLISLTDNLAITTRLNDLRITPGNDSSRPIATRAIPFYYSLEKREEWNNFLTWWSPPLYRQNKTGRVHSFFDNYHTPDRTKFTRESTDIALHQPLLLQHPDKNFYRIEGHIGASYIDVFQIIQTYINQYNLCFDLQMVRLNKATLMLIKDEHILFNDLESLHNIIREEIKCLLTTELNYFRNIRLTKIANKQPATRQTAIVEAQAAPQSGTARTMEDTKFYRTSAAITKRSAFTKMTGAYKFIDFGVTESVANLTAKFQGQLSVADISTMLVANNVGILQTKTTPAAAYVTRIIAALENLDKTLSVDFDDFEIDNYEQALTNLETETRNFVLFAKNLSDVVLKSDSNIVKGEVLDYLDRLLYECDFEKISAIEDERTRREQQVGVNSYLQQYIQNNAGLEHTAGVVKGGTFILVFNEDGTVVADFSLPYRSGGGSNITQYVLGILKTILLAGQVLDVNNAPVLKANVTLNGETLPLDETGRFQKAIIPNSPLLLRVEAEGFEPIQQYTRAEEEDIFKVLTLFTKAQEPKIVFTLTITGPDNKPQPAAVVKLGETVLPLDANGVFKGEVKAKMSPTLLTIIQPGFKTYTDSAFITEGTDKSLAVKLSKLIGVNGTLVGPDQKPVLNAAVTFNGTTLKITDGKFSFKELDGDGSYNLVIEAENMEKFSETIKPNNTDINRTFQLALPITFTVKVGIYVASKPQFETPPTRPTIPRPVFTKPALATRLGGLRGVSATSGFKLATGIKLRDRLTLETELNEIQPLIPIGTGGRGSGTISGKTFSLLDNNDASSQVDGVPQTYNPDLKLFNSNERKALHKLTVKVKSLNLSFAGDLGISNNDVLVLIPARQGYTFQGVYSIVPKNDEANLKTCNAFLVTQLSLPNVPIMGRSFEIRFYTQQDATEFASLMTTAGILYTTLSDR